jgi:rRNA maturation endonuclease Nob1
MVVTYILIQNIQTDDGVNTSSVLINYQMKREGSMGIQICYECKAVYFDKGYDVCKCGASLKRMPEFP